MAARIAMIAITTSSSMRVKPRFLLITSPPHKIGYATRCIVNCEPGLRLLPEPPFVPHRIWMYEALPAEAGGKRMVAPEGRAVNAVGGGKWATAPPLPAAGVGYGGSHRAEAGDALLDGRVGAEEAVEPAAVVAEGVVDVEVGGGLVG